MVANQQHIQQPIQQQPTPIQQPVNEKPIKQPATQKPEIIKSPVETQPHYNNIILHMTMYINILKKSMTKIK